MQNNFQLSERLLNIANVIGSCCTLGDVGCDHALLSIYMVNEGLAENAILSDINEGPLETARNNVKLFSEKLLSFDYRLGDGLKVFKPHEADKIAICGMGGLLISGMIEVSPNVSRNSELYLEPNTCISDLRKFLFENGFSILDEIGIAENNHPYIIIKTKYTGKNTMYDDKTLYLGEFVCNRRNLNDIKYLTMLRNQYKNILEGISKSNTCSDVTLNKKALYESLADKITYSLGE